ncbi:MAG TPA: hypothetical protein VN698_01930 [Bacteroidia bacterium]|nr:hypothetical protein [Bacteroidia bacterium]
MKKPFFFFTILLYAVISCAQTNPPVKYYNYYNYYCNHYDLLKNKTYTLVPSSTTNHTVKNIIVFKPIVEYRYYKSTVIGKNLYDSAFACTLAEVDSNYVHLPKRQKITQDFFSRQCLRKLKQLNDTTIISLDLEATHFIKNELDSIMLLAKNVGINSYSISNRLYNYLLPYKATQFVFTDVLVYEPNYYTKPSQYLKYTLFVFDVETKKLFYYDNRYEGNGHRIWSINNNYSFQTLNDLYVLKRMLGSYKRNLKPYVKHNKLIKSPTA